ncbi:energy transducer TonB [Rhodobacteraceae bacterium SC52]|nr:energy transducer TonB [Rhodobacteraceae bacterium SC52]
MDTGLKVSLGGHAAVLAIALVGWPFSAARDAAPPEAVSVTLVSAQDFPSVGGIEPPAAPEIADQLAALPPPVSEDPPPQVTQPDSVPETFSAPQAPPPPVDRVAPVAQPAPPEPVREGDRVQPEIVATPDPADQALDAEEQDATAPEAAAPEIVTEATETSEAPVTGPSPRPQARPNRPAPEVADLPPPDPEPAPDLVQEPTPPAQPQPDLVQDAVAAALAEALGAQTQSATPSGQAGGPPLSQGERDGLRVAVSRCWNFGALGTDAAKVTVVVGMDMALDGTASNLRLVSQTGGSAGAAQQAYDAARRAVLRCQPFSLPAEKYDQWRTIEMTFNPDEMRRR